MNSRHRHRFSPSTDSSEVSVLMLKGDNLYQENNESKNQQETTMPSVLLSEEERVDRLLFAEDGYFRVKTHGGYFVKYEGSGWFFDAAVGEGW